ncbi:MAG: SusC/RagA family TonB-linked outer membrane protein [Deinococcales bacterium]|nr:SusC/RagA family TonB-linked outer membrane protein [Chitinophagaceae bacterium]
MNYIKVWLVLCVFIVCCVGSAKAQNVNLNSTVKDGNGNPIIGALVSGNAGKTVTYTDKSGHFSVQLPSNTSFSVIAKGFQMRTLRIADKIPSEILLTVEEDALQEVYLPFKKIDKKDVVGPITVLNPETYINSDYNLSTVGGVYGRVAGLTGSNNIWGMQNAIVIIDGIRRDYADITLTEIDQITVLKGVNAVTLYGSQAAKGVILITSKKGEANVRKVSVRANSGLSAPTILPSYLNSADYMALYNEGRRNDGLADLYDAATIQNFRTGNTFRYPSINYYSSQYLKKFQNASDANAEFSGGNANARFYSNIGWSNSSTLLKVGEGNNEGDKRLNVRGNVDLKLNDNISSSVYISAIFNESRRARGNYWGNAASLAPNRVTPLIPINLISPTDKASLGFVAASPNLIDGQYLLGGTQQFTTNPIADLYVAGYDNNIRRTFQVTNKIDANLKSVLKGLSFHTLFNLDYSNSYLQSISNTYAIYVPTWRSTSDSISSLQKFGTDTKPGTQNINNTAQRQNLGFSAWLNYETTIKNDHNFSAILLGYTSAISVNDVYQPITNSHLALQLAYNYKHKYWVDFSTAYVNSTKLPVSKRTGFSPTINVGWLLSSEKFLANSKSIDYLKVSASAGILKTDLDINNYYLYDNIYNRGNFFTWNDGIQAQNQTTTSAYGASPNLTFPQRKEISLSLEGSFFKKLLSINTTFFKTDMSGLPTQQFSRYPNYFSTFIPYTNYNSQQRTGFDLAVNINKKLGNVEFNLGATATYVTSKATKNDELYLDSYQNRQGKPVDAIFGLVNEGLYRDQNDISTRARQLFSEVKPGDIKYKDQNGDGVIDSRDEVMIGRYSAPLNYGVNLTVGYKNFNLFILATGANGGNGILNNNYYWVSGDNKYSKVVINRWTEATKGTATYPRLSSQQNNNNFRTSDFWLYKTDMLNLSKVQLTYNFSQKLLRKTFVNDLLLYVSGSNLLTVSKNSDIMELNVANTPQFRNYTLGIRAKF